MKKTKQKNNKKLVVIISALVVVAAVLVIIIALLPLDLQGSWQYAKNGTTYTFNSNGTGNMTYDGTKYDFTFKVSGKKVNIDFSGNNVKDCAYTYHVKDNKLTLQGEEGTTKLTFELEKIEK